MLQSLIPWVDHPWLLVACLALSVPPLLDIWRMMFGDAADFAEDLRLAALPDWWAWFQGRYWDGQWAELKLTVFALLCVGLPAALYRIIAGWVN